MLESDFPFAELREDIFRSTSRCRRDIRLAERMLNTAIDLAYGQIRTYGAVYSNESNVEDQLIPPILHALGWDTGDPEHVQTKIGV